MSQIVYWVFQTLNEAYRSTWEWMGQLDKQQWLVLLVVTTGSGFLCMRGLGSRAKH